MTHRGSKAAIMFGLSLLLVACTVEGGGSIEYQPPVVPISVRVGFDSNGRIYVGGGFVPQIPTPLGGHITLNTGAELTLAETKSKPYRLFIIWEDSSGQVWREEYVIGQEFRVQFDSTEWVREIHGDQDCIIVVVERQLEGEGGVDRTAIESRLWEYVRVREQAEETIDSSLLQQVCVDPYLSWKTARINENRRDGSHWETRSVNFTITSLREISTVQVEVQVRKTETKLFYPSGSSRPDDEICRGNIYSYRNCTYNALYVLVLRGGQWYVSEVTALTQCPERCNN